MTSAAVKAGEEDRTPDIQLGNGGHSIEFPVEKATFQIDPSTGPSTLCAGIDDFRQLQTMLGTWSLVSPTARLAFLGLLVRMLKKLPFSPAKSEIQPVPTQPLPPLLKQVERMSNPSSSGVIAPPKSPAVVPALKSS